MATENSQKSGAAIQKKQLELRNQLWPGLDEALLWHRKRNNGFITIPRTMPLICRIMDGMTPGKPVSGTYLDLWCLSWDEAFVTIVDEQERAFNAGFTGQRAIYTWRERMRSLKELGFVAVQPGAKGQFHYVLLWNPHLVVRQLRDAGAPPVPDVEFNALIARMQQIGA